MNKKMGYIFIVAGLILVVWGIGIVIKSNAVNNHETITETNSVIAEPNSVIAEPNNESTTEQPETIINDQSGYANQKTASGKTQEDILAENKAKGDAFEAFVVTHFKKKYFTLQEWRSDKYVDGNYPVSSHFPDLEVKFEIKSKSVSETFAIECKWRKSFYRNSIEWANDYQVRNYKEYTERVKIPVFIVIGVGGEPGKPDEVFIVPISKIDNNILTRDELEPYKRKYAADYFHWDYDKNELQ